jgi:peroxiredoxin-like protein
MHPFPHVYAVSAAASPGSSVAIDSAGLPTLTTNAPREFDGPGDLWSPETLLCGAVADCFILSFRAIARASKFEWLKLECGVEGTLERLEGVTQFTRFVTRVTLQVAAGTDATRAHTLLEKAEHTCLISNSLRGERALEINVVQA